MAYEYVVINPQGEIVLQAAAGCRYPKNVELDLLESGYQIRIAGKRVTKKDVRGGN